jgi:hypothetical protein
VTGGVDPGLAHLRVARTPDDLEAVARFYHDGLRQLSPGRRARPDQPNLTAC